MCSAGLVSACFGLFRLIFSHITLFIQPNSAGFSTSRTHPLGRGGNKAAHSNGLVLPETKTRGVGVLWLTSNAVAREGKNEEGGEKLK